MDIRSSLTLECWEALNDIALGNRIDLTWVPGHSNVEGNETADDLAKTGALSQLIGPEPALRIPTANIRRYISKVRNKMSTTYSAVLNLNDFLG